MIAPNIKTYFDKMVDIVFSIILILIMFGVAIGTIQLLLTIIRLLEFKGITGHYTEVISDVLTLYVLIELSRSLVEYFNSHKLRLTFIVDAAIVFVIREMLIDIFENKITPEMYYAYSANIFVLGALRIGSVIVYQREKKIVSTSE